MIGVHYTWLEDKWISIRFSRIDGKIKILQATYYGIDVIKQCDKDFFERVSKEILSLKNKITSPRTFPGYPP